MGQRKQFTNHMTVSAARRAAATPERLLCLRYGKSVNGFNFPFTRGILSNQPVKIASRIQLNMFARMADAGLLRVVKEDPGPPATITYEVLPIFVEQYGKFVPG